VIRSFLCVIQGHVLIKFGYISFKVMELDSILPSDLQPVDCSVQQKI
jgi:hypothetical protein